MYMLLVAYCLTVFTVVINSSKIKDYFIQRELTKRRKMILQEAKINSRSGD